MCLVELRTNSSKIILVWMARLQAVKTIPYFRQGDGSDKKMCDILGVTPRNEAVVWPWFFRLADGIRVQHEIHRG